MKRTLIFLILLAVVVIAVVFHLPKDVTINSQGIKYQLGNDALEQPIHVTIKGKVHRSLLGDRTFKGIVELEGEEMPVPQNQRQLELKFYKEFGAVIIYAYNDRGAAKHHSVGTIYFDKHFNNATIALLEQKENTGSSWSAADGLMITVPATNRQEAVNKSNEIMGKYINGYILE